MWDVKKSNKFSTTIALIKCRLSCKYKIHICFMFNARIMIKCISCWGCACFKGEVNNKTKQASVWASTINYQSVMGKKEPSPLYHARQIPLKLRSSDMQAGIHSHTHAPFKKRFPFCLYISFYSYLAAERECAKKTILAHNTCVSMFFFIYDASSSLSLTSQH